MKYNKIIGIDPGLSGAIAVLDTDGNIQSIYDTPTYTIKKGKRNKNVYDLQELCKILKQQGDAHIVIEKVQPLSLGHSSQASFGLGYSLGMWETLCVALQYSYELVPAKTWQKHFGISGKQGNTKTQSYNIASKLFPKASLTGPRGGKKDGRCDALLMAEWGRRRLVGMVS